MSRKVLDPKTATLEEVAAAHRQVQRDRIIALAVGAAVALGTYLFLVPHLAEGLTIPVLFIALAVGYIPTEEILKRI